MTPLFFVIFSLSRCGSTALCRALNAHADLTCLHEPDFSACNWDERAIAQRVGHIRQASTGFKHVWDPSGFPFVREHRSSLDILEGNLTRVLEANTALLATPDTKVVFLRRRNRLARIISDLLGQQTGLWGLAHPDGRLPREGEVDDVDQYRAAVRTQSIQPVDVRIVEWYLDQGTAMERALAASTSRSPCLNLWYEDVFGPDVALEERIQRYAQLLEYLGVDATDGHWLRPTVESVLRPEARLNDPSTLRLIPNLDEIERRFPEEPLS